MKITTPLAKSVLTGEGILVYASNVLLAVAAALPQGLSWTHAGLYLVILNAVHVVSRTLLKITGIQAGLGLGAPAPVDPVDPAVVAGVAVDIASSIETPQALAVVPPAGATPLSTA